MPQTTCRNYFLALTLLLGIAPALEARASADFQYLNRDLSDVSNYISTDLSGYASGYATDYVSGPHSGSISNSISGEMSNEPSSNRGNFATSSHHQQNCWADGLQPIPPLKPDRQLKQLTASPCLPTSIDFGDPSSPRLENNHTISIYGSGHLLWQGSNDQDAWDHFLAGEMPAYSPILLYHPDGTLLEGPAGEEEAWDVTVETFPVFDHLTGSIQQEPVLFGGTMPPPPGNTNAHFGRDNINRRTYAFHLKNGQWTRDSKPLNSLFPALGWMGHNYGHEFITGKDGTMWMFYERVSEVINNGPTKTEIFARRFSPPLTLMGPEIQIFKIPQRPYPAVVRDSGNLLAEGPRPFAVELQGKTFYIVSFSSSDWGSDHYGINLLWSEKIEGPYQPILNSSGDDLKDFGSQIRADHSLTYGPGRGTFFQDSKGAWWVIFHAAKLEAQVLSPNQMVGASIMRNFFLAPVRITLRRGVPEIEILDRD